MRGITKIQKRDGKIVDFDKDKIFQAIKKASIATRGAEQDLKTDEVDCLVDAVVEIVSEQSEKTGEIPTVEGIQDVVERVLINVGHNDIAKNYIIYRSNHAKIREAKDYLMETFKDLTFKESKDVDAKRENANIDANTAMGTMLKYGSTAANFFVDNYILPKDIADSHRDGDTHIHDKDFFLLTETCCQIDLLKLFKGGFSTGHGFLREPNSITSAAALACIVIQADQNDQHTSNCAFA